MLIASEMGVFDKEAIMENWILIFGFNGQTNETIFKDFLSESAKWNAFKSKVYRL